MKNKQSTSQQATSQQAVRRSAVRSSTQSRSAISTGNHHLPVYHYHHHLICPHRQCMQKQKHVSSSLCGFCSGGGGGAPCHRRPYHRCRSRDGPGFRSRLQLRRRGRQPRLLQHQQRSERSPVRQLRTTWRLAHELWRQLGQGPRRHPPNPCHDQNV